jgi:arylsulfatase A-like enzyme
VPSQPSQPENTVVINPLVLGTWFALLAGFADFLLYAATTVLLHRYSYLTPHIVWLSPLSNVLLFALPGIILWALTRWRPASYWLFTSVVVFVFLAGWGLSTYATHVHPAAALLLTLGIAVQTARVITAHSRGTLKLIRYTIPAMAALAIIGGLALTGWNRLSEKRALAALPRAQQGAPNILLIILDTVRASSLSLYGYERRTSPALERFASRGVTFDLAVSTSPWTLPSHASLFTGRWPHELNADWLIPLDAAHPTLAEVLAESGYATAGFVANHFYAGRQTGLARGFHHYDDMRFSPGRILFGSASGRRLSARIEVLRRLGFYDNPGRKRARDVNHEVLEWLGDLDSKPRPFFVFLNYFDAHNPYIAPAPFNTLFDKSVVPVHSKMSADSVLAPADIASEMAAYDESLTALDHEIGVLLAELERRGALRNTIVVVTSDHGEELGEHGFLRHGRNLYFQVLHVPLIISFGRLVPRGVRVRNGVTLRDVPATLIELARVPNQSATSAPALEGRSLSRFWTDTSSGASSVDTVISEVRYHANRPQREPTSRGDLSSILDSADHLIRGPDGAFELYRVDMDPREKNNLVARPDLRDRVQRLSATLRTLVPPRVRR